VAIPPDPSAGPPAEAGHGADPAAVGAWRSAWLEDPGWSDGSLTPIGGGLDDRVDPLVAFGHHVLAEGLEAK
jgi:hypothetical protein